MTLLGILLAVLLLPQTAGSIEGTVTDGANGRPITNAEVELTRVEGGRVISRKVKVEATGRFSFKNLPPGNGYQLVARGPDLRSTAYGQRNLGDPWKPIDLAPGEHLTDVRITAQSISRIRGTVVDGSGKPVIGARVVAMTPTYVGGRRELVRAEQTQSDTNGVYLFRNLDPGPYYVRVSPLNDTAVESLFINPALYDQTPSDRRSSISKDPEGYPTVYYPGTTLESAQVILLGYGERIEDLTVTVRKVRTSRVRGRILEGIVPRASRVMLIPTDASVDSNWSRVVDSKDGTFDFRAVQPGSYYLAAVTTEKSPALAGRMPVEIRNGETETFDLRVLPAAEIRGRITVAGTDAAGANLSSLSVSLLPKPLGPVDRIVSHPNIPSPSVGATVEADGALSFQGVVPWDYRVVVSPIPRTYVKSARLDNEDVLDRGIRLLEAGQRSLEIVLGTDTGRLDGRTLDDKAQNVSGARVVLVPQARHRRDLYVAVSSSTTGRFQMDVPPGRYKVFAWDGPPEGAWFDPDFLKQYETQGVSVEIGSEASEYLEIKVIP
jgi:hypothetical protein